MRRAQGAGNGTLLGGVIFQSPDAADPNREEQLRESRHRIRMAREDEGSHCLGTSEDDDVDLSNLSDAEEESRQPINARLAFTSSIGASSSAPRMEEPTAMPQVLTSKLELQAPLLDEVVAPIEKSETQSTAAVNPAAAAAAAAATDIAVVAFTTNSSSAPSVELSSAAAPSVQPSIQVQVPHEEASSDMAHAARRLRVAAGTYGDSNYKGRRESSHPKGDDYGGNDGHTYQNAGIEDQVDLLRRQLASLREQLATNQQAHVHRQATASVHHEHYQGAAFVAPYSERPRGGSERKNRNNHLEVDDYRALSVEQLEAMERAAGPFADYDDGDDDDERGNEAGNGTGANGRGGNDSNGSSVGWWGHDASGRGGGCAVSTIVELDLLGTKTRSNWLAPPALVRGPFHPEHTAPLPPRFQPPQVPPQQSLLPSSQRAATTEAWTRHENSEVDLGLQEHAIGFEPFQGSFQEHDEEGDDHHNSGNRSSAGGTNNKTNLRAGLAALEKYGQGLAQELEEARSQLESCHAHHAAELREFDHQFSGLRANRANPDSEDEASESIHDGPFAQGGAYDEGTQEQRLHEEEEAMNQGKKWAGNNSEAAETATAALGEARSLFTELQAAFSTGGYEDPLHAGAYSQHAGGSPIAPKALVPAPYMSPARGSTRSGLRGSYHSSADDSSSTGGYANDGGFGHSRGALPWAKSSPREEPTPKSQPRRLLQQQQASVQPPPPRPEFAPYVHGLGNAVHVSVEKQGVTLVAGMSHGRGADAGVNRHKGNRAGAARAGSIQAAQTRPFGMATSSKRQPNETQRIARAPLLR